MCTQFHESDSVFATIRLVSTAVFCRDFTGQHHARYSFGIDSLRGNGLLAATVYMDVHNLSSTRSSHAFLELCTRLHDYPDMNLMRPSSHWSPDEAQSLRTLAAEMKAPSEEQLRTQDARTINNFIPINSFIIHNRI